MMNLLFALIIWFGQTAVPPAFEVASIKEVRAPSSVENTLAGQFHIGINIDESRADYGFMSLADLIPYAYRVKRYQVSGPSWMIETRWDILAKIPQGQSADRAPEMMQDLLAERFKGRPVVDATDLKGNYHVALELPAAAMAGMDFAEKLAILAGSGSVGVGIADPNALDRSAAMIQAVKRLGLELQSRKAPVETI